MLDLFDISDWRLMTSWSVSYGGKMVRERPLGNGAEVLPFSDPLRDLLSHGIDGHGEAVWTLAREVIHRLGRARLRHGDVGGPVEAADISRLCDALLGPDESLAERLVLDKAGRGMDADRLHLSYIAAATRMMGDRWEEDSASSADVIIGASRVYAIMRRLRGLYASAQAERPDRFRAVFAATPGETHTIGLTMAADHLRRRGWEIDVKLALEHDELVDQINQTPCTIIGLTGSSSAVILPMARLIVALRLSRNSAWIIIGGNVVEDVPDIVQRVGADAKVVTLDDAVAQMERAMQIGVDARPN